MAGLEKLGIAGKETLREVLTNCSDPMPTIEKFQQENGVLLPSLRPALCFLDLHSVSRHDFTSSVFEELRDKIISRLGDLGQSSDKGSNRRISALLDKGFSVIHNKQLRPIIMCALQQVPAVPRDYLKIIAQDADLYKECPIEVKRQLWQENHRLMVTEVSEILAQYKKEVEAMEWKDVSSTHLFQQSAKTRRQTPTVLRLAEMIGRNVRLYDIVLNFLRTLFVAENKYLYCTLRAELIMLYHDADNKDIQHVDQCHKLAWCLDACVREQYVNAKRANELQALLANFSGSTPLLSDIGMLLADPHTTKTLTRSLLRHLDTAVKHDSLPRSNEELIFLLRLLNIGFHAHSMLKSRDFTEPKLPAWLVTEVLPLFVSLVVELQLIGLSSTQTKDESSLEVVLASLLQYTEYSQLVSALFQEFVLQLVAKRERNGLPRLLATVTQCLVRRGSDVNMFVYCLVAELAAHSDDFSSREHCALVFESFFKPNLRSESFWRHCCRLLCAVFPRMNEDSLKTVINDLLPPDSFSADLHTSYRHLVEMIETSTPSPALAAPVALLSPTRQLPPNF